MARLRITLLLLALGSYRALDYFHLSSVPVRPSREIRQEAFRAVS